MAQVATLLGLLGTVAGLVSAFHQIELNAGQIQPGDLAEGIWAALLTTVFGLTIAIPSLLAFHFFESRIDRIENKMSFVVSYLDQWHNVPSRGDSDRPEPLRASQPAMAPVED